MNMELQHVENVILWGFIILSPYQITMKMKDWGGYVLCSLDIY